MSVDHRPNSIGDQLKKFEKNARELTYLADQVHKKTEKLPSETSATKKRAAAARRRAISRTSGLLQSRKTKPPNRG